MRTITLFFILIAFENPAQIDIIEIKDTNNNIIEFKQDVLNEINDNLFLLAYADIETAKKDDTLTINFDLYTSYTIPKNKNIEAKHSEFTNCVIIDIIEKNKIDFVTTFYNEKKLRVGNVRKVILKPEEVGELVVTPMELTVPLKYHFEGQTETELIFVHIKSNEIRIDIH